MTGVYHHQDDDDGTLISGINVTPLVDVALVLLIIFMVTASFIVAQSIPVDLPEAATGETVSTTLAITLTRDDQLYVDGNSITEASLSVYVQDQTEENDDVRVVIAADAAVSHGRVVRIIDLVRQQGVSRFAINIESVTSNDTVD